MGQLHWCEPRCKAHLRLAQGYLQAMLMRWTLTQPRALNQSPSMNHVKEEGASPGCP